MVVNIQREIEVALKNLKKIENMPVSLVKDKIVSLYYDTHKGGMYVSEPKGLMIHCHRPGNSEIELKVWDKNDMIPTSDQEFKSCIKTLPSKITNIKERTALKGYLDKTNKLYTPIPSLNSKLFFENIDWPNTLNYWLYDGVEKDERLVNAFKSCVVPLPASQPLKYQPLNSHQLWVLNSGTGKSRFNSVYGNISTKELSGAGLFGSNKDKYKGQNVGKLQGSGMFMIDEVSELTVANTKEPVINMLLSYLEQGQMTRSLKVEVLCEGTKTIILNSNPKVSDDILSSLTRFVNIVGGEEDDKIRLGRRLGLILFGTDYKPAVVREVVDPVNGEFIRRMIMSTLAVHQKTLYGLYERTYPSLVKDDEAMAKELTEIADGINGHPEVSDLLKGCALATPKIKTAGFRSFILDNLPLLNDKKTKELCRMWAREKDEYISRLHEINVDSFQQASTYKMKLTDELLLEMKQEGLTFDEMHEKTGVPKSTMFRKLKKINLQ